MWAQNVVTKVRLAQSVDLRHFSSTRFNAYRPEQFMAAAMRTKGFFRFPFSLTDPQISRRPPD